VVPGGEAVRITHLIVVVGFLLALGPFDHVVVADLHLLFGLFLGGDVSVGSVVGTTVLAAGGNLVGGLGVVTLTHVEQVRGERTSGIS
jgi:formate/nitrite transporter FocA (FNT family)